MTTDVTFRYGGALVLALAFGFGFGLSGGLVVGLGVGLVAGGVWLLLTSLPKDRGRRDASPGSLADR